MSGACGVPRRCCGVPQLPLSNIVAQSFVQNTPAATALVFNGDGIAIASDSMVFRVFCESNVTLYFAGTLYYSNGEISDLLDVQASILLASAAVPLASIAPVPYEVPPQSVSLWSNGVPSPPVAIPITLVLPIVLPPGTYSAGVQVKTTSGDQPIDEQTVFLDGVMYSTYVRTYA